MSLFRKLGRSLSALCAGAVSLSACKYKDTTLVTCILILACFAPSNSLSQSGDAQQNRNADDLFPIILSIDPADRSAALELLKSQKTLITPLLWHRLITESAKSFTAGETSRSLFLLDVAKYVAEQIGNKRFLAYTHYRIGAVHLLRGNTSLALQAYLSSKALFEEANASTDLMCLLSELAELHALLRDYQKAEVYSTQSLQLSESLSDIGVGLLPYKYGVASAWSTLGKVGMWKGDYSTALTNFQRSLSLWKELNRGGSLYTAHIVNCLTFIGIIYQRIGDHARSLNNFNNALELAKSLADKEREAAVLANIAVLYIEQCDYAKASGILNKNLRIFTESNNKREIASTLINMGVINQRLNNNDAALKEFVDALKIAEEAAALDKVVTAQQGLGTVYYQQSKYWEALEWFNKALSLAQTIDDKIRMTELLWRKGQVYYSLGNYDRASTLADSAADLAMKLRLPVMSYLALTLKGRIHRALKEDEFAFESFSKAIQDVEHLRGLIAGGEKGQQLFFEDKLTPYHEMISLLIEQNNSIEALKYAERSKARVLLDVLRNGRVRHNESLTGEELAEERRLYGEMVSLNAQIRVERMRQQADENRIKELDALLQKARGTYEVFRSTIIAAHPEMKTRGGLLPPLSMEDLDTLIPDARTAVLEYVVTEEQTYLFVLTRDSSRQTVEIKIYSVAIKRSNLSTLVGKFRNQVASNHPGFRQSGRGLYELLVKPANQDLAGITTLCIIPDDLLWELPFQALQTDSGKYLLELSAVYYAPSLQVLSEMKKRAVTLRTSAVSKRVSGRDATLRPHLYAIANPAIDSELLARTQTVRNTPFVSLPETEIEVQTIKAEVYGPETSSTRVGIAAREDSVKAEMQNYRVIHFATHGVLDDRSPLYSYLLLARGENSSEDGLLEAWELMDMDLKAEMVVLSACDTARGSVGAGEGIIGMTWALFVAGVPTTVASQWKVPSEATTRLMVAFHKNAKKVSKAEAWRQAALEMINDPRYRMKPFYWAGFVVMGDDGK